MVPPVASWLVSVVVPIVEKLPFTESLLVGAVVPMPTFLLESTTSPVPPTVRSEEKRLVELAVVEKRFVVVALVVVEFPEMVRLAEIVDEAWEMKPLPKISLVEVELPSVPGVQAKASPPPQPVHVPTESVPMLPEVAKRLVEEAVVLKKFVEVAEVVVERVMESNI